MRYEIVYGPKPDPKKPGTGIHQAWITEASGPGSKVICYCTAKMAPRFLFWLNLDNKITKILSLFGIKRS